MIRMLVQIPYDKLVSFLPSLGLVMQRHRGFILCMQWVIVILYLVLLVIPAFMAFPSRDARIHSNLVLFSQFVFWGIWWPSVILSMLLFGRSWCGIFCPEGALTEWVSNRGLNRTIPRWLKWHGWPTLAFILTTLYSQLISVYDYARAALLVLGGSTIGAIVVGFFFGRCTRVWCRYLCPVSGVFNLLSRLSPICFKTDVAMWDQYDGPQQSSPYCPSMISIRRLNGVSACHMCGRCAGYRHSVMLTVRSCNEEVLEFSAQKNHIWDIRLLLYGMIGIAIGAFTWTVNPWFVQFKLMLAKWLVEYDILWPLDSTTPWWIMTNYPANNDSLNLLDGFCIIFYILGIGLLLGGFLSIVLSLIVAFTHKKDALKQHLAQAFLPIAAAGLFLGLTLTTVKLLLCDSGTLRKLNDIRVLILFGASLWSFYLGIRILARYRPSVNQWAVSLLLFSSSLILIFILWLQIFRGC